MPGTKGNNRSFYECEYMNKFFGQLKYDHKKFVMKKPFYINQ